MVDRDKLRKKCLALIAGSIIFFAILLIPPPPPLTFGGIATFAILALAIILWVTECIDIPVTAMLVLILLSLLEVMPFTEAVKSMGIPQVFLLISVFSFSVAMSKTGLDRRIAFNLLRLAGGRTSLVLLMVILTTVVFVFIIPATVARVTLMGSVCMGLIRAAGLDRHSNIAKAMFILISYITLFGSIGTFTGAVALIFAVSLFHSLIGFSWTYISWMIAFFPVVLIMTFGIWLAFLWIFPPEYPEMGKGREYILQQLKDMDRMEPDELKVSILITVMVILWLTASFHGLSVELVGLICTIFLFMPGFEILTWKEAVVNVNWGTIVLLASSLTIAKALIDTGAVSWLTQTAVQYMVGLTPFTLCLAMLLLMTVIRIGINTNMATVAIMLPLSFSLADKLGINPVWLGMVTIAGGFIAFFLVAQTQENIIAYDSDTFTNMDLFKAGGVTFIMYLLTILFLALAYWPLLGYSVF